MSHNSVYHFFLLLSCSHSILGIRKNASIDPFDLTIRKKEHPFSGSKKIGILSGNRLMTKLADMKSLDQSNKAMRDAVDELCANVRALEVQGVTTEQYGALLMPLIESKLPKDWRLEWAQEKVGLAKEDVGFSKMLKFLEQELDIRESADQSVERQEPFDRHQLEEKETPMLPTASGLMAKPVACTLCNGPHNPNSALYLCWWRTASKN